MNAVAFSPDGRQTRQRQRRPRRAPLGRRRSGHALPTETSGSTDRQRSRAILAVPQSLPTPSSFRWRSSIAPPELRGPSHSSRQRALSQRNRCRDRRRRHRAPQPRSAPTHHTHHTHRPLPHRAPRAPTRTRAARGPYRPLTAAADAWPPEEGAVTPVSRFPHELSIAPVQTRRRGRPQGVKRQRPVSRARN